MIDIAHRFPQNPLLVSKNLNPSSESLSIICVFNPGVFSFEGKTWLIARVAEGITQKPDVIFFPAINDQGVAEIIEVPLNDPELIANDPRKLSYKGLGYLTTISHLRLFC